MKMMMTLSRPSNPFKCAVCLQPKELRPQPPVPKATLDAFLAGEVPHSCADCGAMYDFGKNKAAFRRYRRYVTEHTETDTCTYAGWHEAHGIPVAG